MILKTVRYLHKQLAEHTLAHWPCWPLNHRSFFILPIPPSQPPIAHLFSGVTISDLRWPTL